MQKITIDPEFKALIPPLSAEEFGQLEANIIAYGGARDPLVVWNGTLIDGHNRYEICTRLSLPFQTVELKAEFSDRDDALLWIIDNQAGRRNIPPFARSELGFRKAQILEKRARAAQAAAGAQRTATAERAEDGKLLPAKPSSLLFVNSQKASSTPVHVHKEVARFAGIGEQSASKAIAIVRNAPEPIKEQLRRNETTIHAAYTATKALEKMPEPQREAVIKQVAAGVEVKRALGEVKLEAKRELADEIRRNPVVTPDGRYQVIVSDPPWKYDKRSEDTTHRGKNLYPEMTVDEICKLPVASLAQDDCVLWLWTTNAFMRGAYQCLDAWGFEEKTILTWDKEILGLGDWLRNQTEHCILAVKGKPKVDLRGQTTIIREKRREHSRKPEAFYKLVEELCLGSKLEMFSRTPRNGWAAWGAETDKFAAAE